MLTRARRRRPACAAIAGCLCIVIVGCAGPRAQATSWRNEITSPDRLVRLGAIAQAAQAPREEAVPALIDRLDDEDDVVRAMAHEGLRSVTGQSFPFDPLGSAFERRRQVAAWREWWEKEEGATGEDAGTSSDA